jgi:hypothetical protein
LPANEVHVDDYGTIFRFTIYNRGRVVDFSNPEATTKDFIFTDPDGVSTTKAGTFYTDGSDGIVQYVTISGLINKVGDWQVQVHIESTDGSWKTDIHDFTVYSNL